MNNCQKFLSLLGLCRKAGKLSCGHDSAIGSIRSRSACLCLLSNDSSERLREEIKRVVEFSQLDIQVITVQFGMDEIGFATGLKSAVVTVNDEGFAKAMLREIGG